MDISLYRFRFNILTVRNYFFFLVGFLLLLSQKNCTNKVKQKNLSRFESAQLEKQPIINFFLSENGVAADSIHIFLRAFKAEQVLELWVKNRSDLSSLSESGTSFRKMKSYPFCESSGQLGPKRKEGDLQIPEGIYHIDRFNEKSLFHLSLGLNYPNTSDLIRGDKETPGTDIFIHGGCQTVGCIPITDDMIKELFVIAAMAKAAGQTQIPVHIFPFQFSERKKEIQYKAHPTHVSFWNELEAIYLHFEKTKTLPIYSISPKGAYSIDR